MDFKTVLTAVIVVMLAAVFSVLALLALFLAVKFIALFVLLVFSLAISGGAF